MLNVNHLHIIFQDDGISDHAVNDISFQMGRGDILGVVGESGSGKTLTALAIAGLLPRHDLDKKGEILFQGVDLLTCNREKLRKIQGSEIAMIFQEPMTSLNPVIKIGKQVEESLRIHTTLSKKERKKKAIDVMRQVELKDTEKIYEQYPHQLSGGMRQRVMIAAAIINHPQILIADEPTTALDALVQHEIISLLNRICKEEEMSLLFISHDLSLVSKICNHLIVMKNGKIIERGDTKSIFSDPKESYTKQLIDSIPKWDLGEANEESC